MYIVHEGLDIDPALVRVACMMDTEKPVVHIAVVLPGHLEKDKRFIAVGSLIPGS